MKTIKLNLLILIALFFSINTFGQAGYSSGSVSQGKSNQITSSDQVIVEEYINYHKHRIPMPEGDERVAMDVRWGNKQFSPANKEAILQIGFTTNSFDDYSDAPLLNLSLVVDESGSMDMDQRMIKLKFALIKFVKSLRENDVISIVTYSDSATTVLAPQKVGNAKLIEMVIDKLQTRGSTNLNSGMVRGYEEVLKNFNPSKTNKVILLTDGCANEGVTKTEDIVKNSKAFNDKGIEISTIGVGKGVNYNLLRQIAKNGKGSNHFIGDAEDIEKVFVDEVESLLSPIAKHVNLEIEYDKKLELNQIYGYQPQLGKNKISFDLDDMNSGLTQVILIKFDINQQWGNANRKVKVNFSFYDLKSKQTKTISKEVELDYLKDSPQDYLSDKEVKRNYSIAILAQSLKDMAKATETNKDKEACSIIEKNLKDFHAIYPKPKDKAIKRVLKIVKEYECKEEKGGYEMFKRIH